MSRQHHHRESRGHLTRVGIGVAGMIVGTSVALTAGHTAEAQAPDVRDVRPAITLLVDTSLSMEFAMGSATGSDGRMPACGGGGPSGPSGTSERSRWITLVESLTGEYTASSYYCQEQPRGTMALDIAGLPNVDREAVYPFHRAFGTQVANGILDNYRDRVSFGLMTYDNLFGLDVAGRVRAELERVPYDFWDANLGLVTSSAGDFSYGPNRNFTYYGCPTTYRVNGGVRRNLPTASGGAVGLIPFSATDGGFRAVNDAIQSALLNLRTYGPTPTAAMLDDYEQFLVNDPTANRPIAAGQPGDPFAACRSHYAILLTDGQPTDPFRYPGQNCEALGPNGETYVCPYPRSEVVAHRLCNYAAGTGCTGEVDGIYVVGFLPGPQTDVAALHCTVNPTSGQIMGGCVLPGGASNATTDVYNAINELNRIADAGGTSRAYLASNRASLVAALTAVIDNAAPGTTTRTVPAFVNGSSSSGQVQYQVNTGFVVGGQDGSSRPWTGVLDRTRWVCDANLVPQPQTLVANQDQFHVILNNRAASRRLFTALASNPADTPTRMVGTQATAFGGPAPGAIANVSLTNFELGNSTLSATQLGLAAGATAQRSTVINWVRADTGSGRENARLGDIYHSSPTVVTAPTADIADESFNLFRRRPEVATRPTVLYVGTNDGVFHAFAMDNSPTSAYTQGTELWGFVPPGILSRLNDATTAHQFLVDATPVVRDVFFAREQNAAPDAASYHTVLVSGLRQGGPYYFALDVTQPENPSFLWQYTAPDIGDTYGRPVITQALVDWNGNTMERAVAILPGGHGPTVSTGACPRSSSQRAPVATGASRVRTEGRCWSSAAHSGRALHVIDVATGTPLRTFGPSEIPAPMVGSVSAFTNDTGSISTRAFVSDADGVIWRLDLASSNPTLWTFRPFHDVYWAATGLDGHPAAEPPIVSIDSASRPVIVMATGDLDDLEAPGLNYVASITEVFDGTNFVPQINWDLRLRNNEQVTGPLELFESYVYFGTFASAVDPTNACEFGSSRLWGVHFTNNNTMPSTPTVVPSGYSSPSSRFPTYGLTSSVAVTTPDTHFSDLGQNQIIMGVGVTQRPTCFAGQSVSDPYLGQRYQVNQTGGGNFQLVAQVAGRGQSTSATATSVQTVTRTLQPPPSATRPIGWVSGVDY